MEVIYLLIPLSLLLVGLIVWLFAWAIRSGQFDDLEGPAWRILMDDDDIKPENEATPCKQHPAPTYETPDKRQD
jgi:cbb3-type cytochrome oxidase maturation protein